MDYAEFHSYSPREFSKLLEIKTEERAGIYRQDMERMRLQTLVLVNAQLPEKSQVKRVEDLIKFEWDEKKPKQDEDARELTDDEWEKFDDNYPVGHIKKDKEDG